jgi:hypothetical protein
MARPLRHVPGAWGCARLMVSVAATFGLVTIGTILGSYGVPMAAAAPSSSGANSVVAIAPTPDDMGYRTITANGFVSAYGDADFASGQAGGPTPVVGIDEGSDGPGGFWTVRADGGVFTSGDAPFYGSMGGKTLNSPVVGMAAGAAGGYWLVGADGGVFSFGGAPFFGSMAGHALNAPVTGVAALSDGQGYWLVGADNGVFTFGKAPFFGPTYS